MQRMIPPKGANDVRLGNRKVGPEGCDVDPGQVQGLIDAGWTKKAAAVKPRKGVKTDD